MKSGWSLLLLPFLLAAPKLARLGQSDVYEGGRSRDATARAARNSSAAAKLLGEFRATLSDILFVKTERYLHNGVAYTQNVQGDSGSLAEIVHSQGDAQMPRNIRADHTCTPECDHDHEEEEHHADDHDHEAHACGGETLIPAPEHDFRGWIGNLHRMVKPWQGPNAPHAHADPLELLPWYRLITLADPHNVRGFALGAWWLSRHDLHQAFIFINEGIAANPRAFQLYLVRAGLHYSKARELNGPDIFHPTEAALPHFHASREDYQLAADIALQTRPAGLSIGESHPDCPPSMDTDTMTACAMAVLFERTYGDPARALSLAAHYLSILPNQPTLQKFLTNHLEPDTKSRDIGNGNGCVPGF